jgi:TP901 family phage tail tape measure protein
MALQQTVKFSADIEKALADFKKYADGLLAINSAIEKVRVTTIKMGQESVEINFEGALKDGNKLVGVARDMGEGFENVTVKVKEASEALKDAAKITSDIEKKTKATAAAVEKLTKQEIEYAKLLTRIERDKRKASADTIAAIERNEIAKHDRQIKRINDAAKAEQNAMRAAQNDLKNRDIFGRQAGGAFVNGKFTSNVASGKVTVADRGEVIKMTKSVDDLTTSTDKLTKSTRGYLLSFTEIARIAEATVLKQVIGSINDALQDGVRNAVQFQIAISEIRTISQENQLSFSQWGKEIKKVSDELGLPIADVAAANYEALSNQVVEGANSFQFLSKAGDFARTTQSSLKDSVNLLSSAFNAYGISTAEAERVSAVLFKTIDLGRIRSSELADTFGRVLFLAETLGVSFEEVNTGMATLTIQGVKTADAQTLLTNIFQKLLKPTERMKEVFKSWGVETGQAAIQTFKFTGVVQKLIDLSAQGDVDIGELFNEIRGRKGFEGLANFSGQFEKNLGKITDSLQDYRKAVQIRGESPADFLVKETNKLKNNINENIGQPILKFAADLLKSFQTISPEFVLVKDVALLAGQALTVYAAASLLATGKTLLLDGALKKLNYSGGLFIATIAAGAYVVNRAYEQQIKKTTEYGDALVTLQDKIKDRDLLSVTGGTASEKRFTALRNDAELTYKAIAQSVATARIGIDGNLDKIQAKTGLINTALQERFKSYFESLNDGIQKTQRAISQTETNINAAKNAKTDFEDTTKDIIFQSKFEFATPEQQRTLLAKKIDELEQEATELSAKIETDPQRAADNAKRAQDNLKQAAALVREDQGILVQMRVEAAKASGFTGAITVDSLENNQRLLKIKQAQVEATERIIAQEEKRKAQLEEQKKLEEERLNRLKNLAKEFTDFTFQNKDGNVKPEFREKLTNRLDPEKALAALNAIEVQLRDAIGNDGAGQLQLVNLIEAKRATIYREAGLNRLKTETELHAKSLENQRKFGQERLDQAREQAKKGADSVFGPAGALASLSALGSPKALGTLTGGGAPTGANVVAADLKDVLRGDGKNTETKRLQAITKGVEDYNATLAEYNRQIERIKSNPDVFDEFGTVKPEELAVLEQYANRLKQLYITIFKARRPDVIADPLSFGPKPEDGGPTVPAGDIFGKIFGDIEAAKQGRRDVIGGIGSQNAAQQQLNKVNDDPVVKRLKNIQAEIPGLGNEMDKVTPRIQTNFKNINDAVDGTRETVRKLNEELQKMALPQLGGKTSLNTADPFEGVAPIYAATGGVIGLHPGSPRGTDTEPAWLTPGERVLSVAQNRQYERLATLLRPLTAQPRYYSQGGTVTTTVGDIHISVPSSTPANAVAQIGQLVQRGIKRGRIQL